MRNNKLLEDTQKWLALEDGGIMGLHRYSDPKFNGDPVNGVHYYQQFLKVFSDVYYPRLADQELFDQVDQIDYPVLGNLCLFSQGPGMAFREKDFKIGRKLGTVKGYVANDISSLYARAASQAAMEEFQLSRCQSPTVGVDFFSGSILTKNLQDSDFVFEGTPVMVVAGLTLSNISGFPENGLPRQKVYSTLKLWKDDLVQAFNLSSNAGAAPHLIISIDHTQNGSKVEAAYAGQAEFTKNLPHRLKRDLVANDNFDPYSFSVQYTWHSTSSVITHDLYPQKTMTLLDDSPSMEKDQRYIVNNTYKYPREFFREIVDDVGFDVKKSYRHPKHDMELYFLEARL